MACGYVGWIDGFYRVIAHLQIFGQFVAIINAPIHEIGIGENRPVSWRLNLVPIRKRPVPRFVELIERLVLTFQPLAEPLQAAGAIAEHRFRVVSDSRPIESGGFTPQIPSIE